MAVAADRFERVVEGSVPSQPDAHTPRPLGPNSTEAARPECARRARARGLLSSSHSWIGPEESLPSRVGTRRTPPCSVEARRPRAIHTSQGSSPDPTSKICAMWGWLSPASARAPALSSRTTSHHPIRLTRQRLKASTLYCTIRRFRSDRVMPNRAAARARLPRARASARVTTFRSRAWMSSPTEVSESRSAPG